MLFVTVCLTQDENHTLVYCCLQLLYCHFVTVFKFYLLWNNINRRSCAIIILLMIANECTPKYIRANEN